MGMQDWLAKYPKVRTLMQQETDILDYLPDGEEEVSGTTYARRAISCAALVLLLAPASRDAVMALVGEGYDRVFIKDMNQESLGLRVSRDGVLLNTQALSFHGDGPDDVTALTRVFLLDCVGDTLQIIAEGGVCSD